MSEFQIIMGFDYSFTFDASWIRFMFEAKGFVLRNKISESIKCSAGFVVPSHLLLCKVLLLLLHFEMD